MNLINTIQKDIEHYNVTLNKGLMVGDYLDLIPTSNAATSNLYQLRHDGEELWLGTPQEINAVVKSLIKLKITTSK